MRPQGSVINVPLTEEEKLEIRTALYSIGANLPTPGNNLIHDADTFP